MKRFWTMLLVVAVALVMALPAGAVKPPKPPTAVPIAVSMNAEPVWVHEAEDLIRYEVTLENKTGSNVSDVAVMFTTTDTDVYPVLISDWDSTEENDNGVVPANSNVWMKFYLYVHQFDEAVPCLTGGDPEAWPDECALLATAEVLIDGEVVTQTEMSMPLMPEPSCGFTTYEDDWVSNSVTVNDLCIWTLPEDGETTKTGVWEITLWPTLPDNTRKPLEARVDVRDGVPGNWCTLAIGDPWGFGDRWKAPYPDDLSVTGRVYLPGAEDHSGLGLDNGTCLSGGAGGDYFKVGNPKAFYLRANGDVTVKWVSATP